MKIALTGNPNSGKTTMYNALTGKSGDVGNWAGVTVDKKEHNLKKSFCDGGRDVIAVDLPGAYSMSPFTGEESITSDYIKNEHPDVIVNIVDATNLSRSLFFTTQLLELGIPVTVALNKSDLNKKKKTVIDTEKLSELLGCPVVDTISTSADGLAVLIKTALGRAGESQTAPYIQDETDFSDKEAVGAADRKRYAFVNELVRQVETREVFTKDRNTGDKIDAVITNRFVGLPVFAVVMGLVFQISQVWVGPYIADALSAVLEMFQDKVRILLADANPLLSSILVDGILGGLSAVLGFLPLVMVMYFLIAILEDCGYMARAAVVLDPIFKKVGLSGKSVIPFVITVGCAVPGIMSSRTIRNERERRAAVMLTPFIPCGAKIPVIALFAGIFFENAGWVSALMYFSGIVLIFFGALLINAITGYNAKKAYFIIELPEYRFPSLTGAFKSMCSRGWEYIVKAATIILLCNTAIKIMQSFDTSFHVAERADRSILAMISVPFAYIFVPIVGVLSWQLAAAAITGFIAKENIVGTLAVCFAGLNNLISTDELVLAENAGSSAAAVISITKTAALAYLMFNLFSPPCFAAISAMNAEMKSRKWFWGAVGLQFTVGYTVSYFVYTIGTLITNPSSLSIPAALCGLAGIAAAAAVIGIIIAKSDKNYVSEYSTQ